MDRLRGTAKLSSVASGGSILDRYHVLVDHKLAGTLSAEGMAELEQIEGELDDMSSPSALEKDMGQLLQQLGDLTSELRKIGTGQQPSHQKDARDFPAR